MLIGIDLGTTNSAVALWQTDENGGAAQLVPNALGALLTPSAVSVLPDGTTLVGAAALERRDVVDHVAGSFPPKTFPRSCSWPCATT